jgi:hypothetical protein
MKSGCRLLSALALLALPALPSPALASGDGPSRPSTSPTLDQAVHDFVGDWHELVMVQRLSASEGRELYRFEGTATGRREEAQVDPKAPTAPRGGHTATTKAYNVVGGSTRCVVYFYKDNNYGNLILTTDLDWNDLSAATGLSDVISSLQTTCAGIWLFTGDNYNTGTDLFYYAPANTNLATLPTMNNAITSFKHDLP